jgi:hypothetical protein
LRFDTTQWGWLHLIVGHERTHEEAEDEVPDDLLTFAARDACRLERPPRLESTGFHLDKSASRCS